VCAQCRRAQDNSLQLEGLILRQNPAASSVRGQSFRPGVSPGQTFAQGIAQHFELGELGPRAAPRFFGEVHYFTQHVALVPHDLHLR
jgi:hypothetical protein